VIDRGVELFDRWDTDGVTDVGLIDGRLVDAVVGVDEASPTAHFPSGSAMIRLLVDAARSMARPRAIILLSFWC